MPEARPAVDLDLRIVRYFTTVAEHGHFGHAADTLYLTQPSLSRYVRRLERDVGARLLDRTPQGVRLTEAGQVFLEHATALLDAADAAVGSAREAATPRRITIGHSTNLVITPAVRELRSRNPDAEVNTLHVDWDEPRPALLENRVDAVVARMPFATDQLDVTVLYEEPRVLLVFPEHRLAGQESVELADFADEPLLGFPDPGWRAFWRIDPRPDGSPAPEGPTVYSIEDYNEFVAGGEGIGLAPGGSGTATRRPDLVQLPVRDIGTCQVVLAARHGDDNGLVDAFRRIAREQLTEP